jgi:hypothetical protein
MAVFTEWQPICTAPKDGTSILIFETDVGSAGLTQVTRGIVRVSRWRDDDPERMGRSGKRTKPLVAAPGSSKVEAAVVKDAAARSLAATAAKVSRE